MAWDIEKEKVLVSLKYLRTFWIPVEVYYYFIYQDNLNFLWVLTNAKSTSISKTFKEQTDHDILFTCDIHTENLEVLKMFINNLFSVNTIFVE